MSYLSEVTAALLGRSTYQPPDSSAHGSFDLDDPHVTDMRRRMGGQLQLPNVTQTRWYRDDLEYASLLADGGNLEVAARLMRAAYMDGTLAGVLSTRTSGLVGLPKRFRGDSDVIEALEVGHDSVRSVFDEMFPPTELELLAKDGTTLGVGVGELVPVDGRDYPVFVRLDPEFLLYRWIENRWYYRSVAGLIHITPGDGRWILHTPGGRMAPWQNGLWRAIGSAYIRKDHAQLNKDNWESKLANPARVAVSPQAASEAQKQSWFQSVMAWGINSVFGMTPGYDVKLIESNGRGFDSFNTTIAQCDEQYVIAVAGQVVTTTGGTGFANADIHKSIRADLIKKTADGLSYTLNTQGIPAFIAAIWGPDAVETRATVVEWDVTPPKDRNAEAQSLLTTANAITALDTALMSSGRQVDVAAICTRFGVPIMGDADGDGNVDATGDATARPQLRLIEGGKSDSAVAADGTVGDVAPTDAAVTAEKSAQDTALNGAQIASLLEIIQAVADGLVPRDSGLAIIKRAFLVDDAGAEELMGSVGKGFVPSSAAPAVAPAAPPPSASEAA